MLPTSHSQRSYNLARALLATTGDDAPPLLKLRSWDDWVAEDRLRKLTQENRELANNLRHEVLAAQRAARAQPPPSKKKTQGSTRGSEERQMSVSAAGPRGQKRMRDQDLEKVSILPEVISTILMRLAYSRISCNGTAANFLPAGRDFPESPRG